MTTVTSLQCTSCEAIVWRKGNFHHQLLLHVFWSPSLNGSSSFQLCWFTLLIQYIRPSYVRSLLGFFLYFFDWLIGFAGVSRLILQKSAKCLTFPPRLLPASRNPSQRPPTPGWVLVFIFLYCLCWKYQDIVDPGHLLLVTVTFFSFLKVLNDFMTDIFRHKKYRTFSTKKKVPVGK